MKASLRHVLTIPPHHPSKDDLFRRIEESNPSVDQSSDTLYGGIETSPTPSTPSAHHGASSSSSVKSSRIKIMEIHPCSPTLVRFCYR